MTEPKFEEGDRAKTPVVDDALLLACLAVSFAGYGKKVLVTDRLVTCLAEDFRKLQEKNDE